MQFVSLCCQVKAVCPLLLHRSACDFVMVKYNFRHLYSSCFRITADQYCPNGMWKVMVAGNWELTHTAQLVQGRVRTTKKRRCKWRAAPGDEGALDRLGLNLYLIHNHSGLQWDFSQQVRGVNTIKCECVNKTTTIRARRMFIS